jgi:TolB-like protein
VRGWPPLSLARSFFAVAVTLATASCATFAPARHGAATIAVADQVAKTAVANESSLDVAKIPPRAVSVLPFTVSSQDTLLAPLSYAMSAFLLADLGRSRDLQLVERERIDAIYRELDLIDQGITDPRTGPRVGRLVGARRVVIGSVTSAPGGQVILGARIVDAIAGTVQEVATGTATLDRIFEAQNALALRLFEQLGVNVTPALRAAVEERETNNVAATVAFGRGLKAEAKGDLEAARRAFEDAARMDIGFGAARTEATRLREKEAAVASGGSGSAASSLSRVVNLTASGINVPVTTKIPEAADAPAQSLLITLLITLRVF